MTERTAEKPTDKQRITVLEKMLAAVIAEMERLKQMQTGDDLK